MRWRGWLLLIVLVWPAAELIALTLLVDRTSPGAVVALIVVTAALGIAVIVGARRRWREATAALRATGGARPATEASLSDVLQPGRLSDPALSLVAGVLLVLPGPVGDVVGLALLIPGVRALVAAWFAALAARRFPQATASLRTFRIRSSGTIVPGQAGQSWPGGENGGPSDPDADGGPSALPPGPTAR